MTRGRNNKILFPPIFVTVPQRYSENLFEGLKQSAKTRYGNLTSTTFCRYSWRKDQMRDLNHFLIGTPEIFIRVLLKV